MTETQTVDLASWLTAVWDEEERRELAKRTWRPEAPPMDVTYDDGGVYVNNPGSSIRHWLSAEDYERTYLTPAPNQHALARIAADRKILAFIQRVQSNAGEPPNWDPEDAAALTHIVRLLASPYKGREGWQEAGAHE